MRYLALAAAFLLMLSLPSPAHAGVGLPKLATVVLDGYEVRILNDSPDLQTGRNTLTVEVNGLPEDHQVKITLAGPAGEQITVPLQKVRVLAGIEGGHGDDGHGTGDESGNGGHGEPSAKKDDHAAPSSGGHDDGDEHANGEASYIARGRVVIKSTGTWKITVSILDDHGDGLSNEVEVTAVQGGPNRIVVGVSGFLMGGTFLYGFVKRRIDGSVRR